MNRREQFNWAVARGGAILAGIAACIFIAFGKEKDPNWYVALATIGLIAIAYWQRQSELKEAASLVYFEGAEAALKTAVSDFLAKKTPEGWPLNDRRHWLNFARGVINAQRLASNIESFELREIWMHTEHYWRERTYDELQPMWASFPATYYGYTAPNEAKNIGTSPDERQPLAEASLVFVYRWVDWPATLPDVLDRKSRFTDKEIERMASFGPQGLAEYLHILRKLRKPKSQPTGSAYPIEEA